MHRPPWLGLLLVLLLVPVFVALGQWQWQKGERKAAAQNLRDTRGADAAVELPTALLDPSSELAAQLHYRPVRLRGQFVPEQQFLLDNRVHRERAGFHVITPFRLANSSVVVLVNRGWVPVGASHTELPAIATPAGFLDLTGIAVLPPSRFFSLSATGNTPDWKSAALPVWQWLDQKAFATLSGLPTQGLIVQLDATAAAGFVREWPRPDERIERHYSYALQWFGFAIAAIAIGLYFVFRRARP